MSAVTAPPLTEQQLTELQKVDAWEIRYRAMETDTATGTGTHGVIEGLSLGRAQVSAWSSFSERRETVDARLVVSGGAGCSSGCIPNNALPWTWTVDEAFHAVTDADVPKPCPPNPAGTGQAGHQSATVDVISGGTLTNDGKPLHTLPPQLGLRIDYSTNPPRAEEEHERRPRS